MKQLIQDNPSIILGNQKWKGKDPIFIKREILIKIDRNKFQFKNKIIFIRIKKIKLIEAIDWVKKYFKEASLDNKFLELEIKGINLKRLISKPIQHPNHELAEIVINVLKNNV